MTSMTDPGEHPGGATAPPRQGRSTRLAETILVVALVLAALSFLVVEVYDLDVFWNLAIGRDILARHEVPSVDRYTVAGEGHPYPDIHWLFQVALATVHALGGWSGVGLLAGLCWAVSFFLVFRAAARRVSPGLAALLLFPALLASVERFLPRPELATILGIAIFLERLDAGAFRRKRDLALLAVVQCLWTNTHGLFVFGPFLVLCRLAEALLPDGRRGRLGAENRSLLRLVAILLAATLATPHGFGSWRYAWLLVTQVGPRAPRLFGALGELSPTFGRGFLPSPAFWGFVVLLGIVSLLLVLALLRRRPLPLHLLLAGATFGALATSGRRNVVLFALAAPPLAAALAALLRPGRPPLPRRVSIPAAAAILLFTAYPLSGYHYLHLELPARFGLGVTPSFFPHRLPPFLDRIGFRENVFNSNSLGGWYMEVGWPERRPLTEGRWTAYDETEIERILSVPTDPVAFEALVRRYRIGGVLLAHTSPESRALVPRLIRDPAWRLVWLDAAASFWLPESAAGLPPRIDPESAPLPVVLRPDDGLILEAFLADAGTVAPRTENLRRTAELGWRREELLERRAHLLLEAGRMEEAEGAFRELTERFPKNAGAWNERAFFAFRRGDAAGAEECLARSLSIDPGNSEVRANLERVRAARTPAP
jgi:hypothetical protein